MRVGISVFGRAHYCIFFFLKKNEERKRKSFYIANVFLGKNINFFRNAYEVDVVVD